MIGILVTLLIIWLALSIIGFIVEGLFWLAIVGVILFIATSIVGWFKRKVGPRS